MAYSKNEKKLKEYLKKQDDTKQPNKQIKGNSGKPSNDKNLRRRRHI